MKFLMVSLRYSSKMCIAFRTGLLEEARCSERYIYAKHMFIGAESSLTRSERN